MLTELEAQSAVWQKIEHWAVEQLTICRERNDCYLPIEETERLRGEIKTFKRLLALGKTLPPVIT